MHESSDGSAAFVFDLMEPERPATDRKVLEFVKGHVNIKVTFSSMERHADQMARNWQISHSGDMATYWAKNINFFTSPAIAMHRIRSMPF